MQTHAYYSTEYELDMQYNLCSAYLIFNEYEGCEVDLSENFGSIDFELFVDFNKTTDDIYEVLYFEPTEQDYIESNKDSGYTILKYNEFLGIRIFAGFI